MRQEFKYTPVGRAKYPHLTTPNVKFNPAGALETKLILTEAEAAPIKAAYDAAYEEFYREECTNQRKKELKRATTSPFSSELRDDGSATGNVIISFKDTASYKDKVSGNVIQKRLRIVDSQKKDVKQEVWGGSEIKLAYIFKPWYTAALGFGMGLRPMAVQVISLVSKGDGGAALGGFDVEEGGYVADADDLVASEVAATVETTNTEGQSNVAPAIKGNF